MYVYVNGVQLRKWKPSWKGRQSVEMRFEVGLYANEHERGERDVYVFADSGLAITEREL